MTFSVAARSSCRYRRMLSAVCVLWLSAMSIASSPVLVLAQEDQAAEAGIEYPLQIVHLACVDRLQEKADAMFLAADRPEMSDIVAEWIRNNDGLRDLKGLDRTRPFGMMFYIKPGLTPGISAISYLPYTEKDDALEFLAGPEGQVKPVTGATDRYEITNVSWGPDLQVKVQGSYLFLVELDNATELDRKFPDPRRLVTKLNNRYEIAYSLLLKNLPPATRTLFLEFFKNQAQADLQQRDNEPDAAYRIRRASGESIVDILDLVVNQGEDITLGGFVNAEDQSCGIELEVNGSKDSGLVKFFKDTAGSRSYFHPLLDDPSTVTHSSSWKLDPKRRKVFTELFQFAPEIIDNATKAAGVSGDALASVQPFFRTLHGTAEQGILDLFVQLSGNEALEHRLVGGFRILGSSEFPDELKSVLEFLATLSEEQIGPKRVMGIIGGMTVNERQLGGYPMHVIPLPDTPEGIGRVLFGEKPSVYLVATPQALWYALGQESARDHLEACMKRADDATSTTTPRPSVPFLLTSNSRQWVNVGTASGANADDPEFSAFQRSFTDENDEIRITGRPTDSGLRFRVEMQSGYLGWLGRAIATTIDSNL